MRLALVLSLVGLVLLCPSICGAADSDDHAHHQQPAGPRDDSPVHCPDEGTSCVCDGAVRAADPRAAHLDLVGPFVPALFDLSPTLPLSTGPLALSARDPGPPTSWGPRAARAMLQNFRF